jgi:hypothetical protein
MITISISKTRRGLTLPMRPASRKTARAAGPESFPPIQITAAKRAKYCVI